MILYDTIVLFRCYITLKGKIKCFQTTLNIYVAYFSLFFGFVLSKQDLAFKYGFADFKTAIKQFIAALRLAVTLIFKRDKDNVCKTYHWNFEM